MKKELFLVAAMLVSTSVLAGGDKNQKQRPVEIPEDTCIVIVPEEVDLTGCTQTSVPPQGGFVSWNCPYTVYCEDDIK